MDDRDGAGFRAQEVIRHHVGFIDFDIPSIRIRQLRVKHLERVARIPIPPGGGADEYTQRDTTIFQHPHHYSSP